MKKFWLESSDEARYGDFPFYNGKPFALSWGKWITWFVVTVGTFLISTGDIFLIFGVKLKKIMDLSHGSKNISDLVFLIIFLGVLLGTFWLISKHDWKTLFRKLHKNEVWFAVIGGPVALGIVGLYIKFVVENIFGIQTVSDAALDLNKADAITSFVSIIFQLLGEELGAIVPFLFIFMVCHKAFHWHRGVSVGIAWFLSSMIFGVYHLSAYNDSWLQVILVIGVSRMILTIPYIRYKNIWASYLFHLAYDFLPILVAVVRVLAAK